MHSFHQSRGKTLFEVLCGLAIAASLTGAWMQTGASALLAAAGVAALYGFVHLFDLRRQKSVGSVQPQLIELEEERPGDLLTSTAGEQKPVAADEPEEAGPTEKTEPVERAVPKTKAGRRAKAPRKGSGHRASAPRVAQITELAPPEEPDFTGPAPPADATAAAPISLEEAAPVVLAPLFEPEPFVRQQRAVFGRKAG